MMAKERGNNAYIYVVQTKRMTGKVSETGSWLIQYHKCGIIKVRFFPWDFCTHDFFFFFFYVDLLRREISLPRLTCRTSSWRIVYYMTLT